MTDPKRILILRFYNALPHRNPTQDLNALTQTAFYTRTPEHLVRATLTWGLHPQHRELTTQS